VIASRAVASTIALLLAVNASRAGAQVRPRRETALPRAGAARQLPEDRAGNRAQLERRFRQTLYQVTRRRVGLSDAQMNRLMPINQRFETQRRAIQRQERETRLGLREAMRDSTNADQGRITSYLDKLVELQRQRVELVAQEQRDLAAFMTPLQRARYTALQEQVRRRIEQMLRQNRAGVDTSARALPNRE
jgi:Zn-dependent M32 family carboxypeptidase